jgi:hypothetical protein
MAIRSVDEIINLSDSSKNPEKLAFKDLVKHIDPRVRERAPRHTSLHFKIPGMLWGQPVYDAYKVEKMIVRHYKSIGFKCDRLGEREILIKWGEDDSYHSEASRDAGGASASSDSDDTDSSEESESAGSTASSEEETTDSETTDSDGNDESGDTTKNVTIEQIPLSKRLSIVNNQMQNNM